MHTKGKTVIIVLGDKLDQHGRPTPVFQSRLRAALAQMKSYPDSVMVITGGKTQAEFPSEAEVGKEFLLSGPIGILLREMGYEKRILVETEARSTSEHPLLVKALLEAHSIRASWYILVTSSHRVWRAHYYFFRDWRESQITAFWVTDDHEGSIVDRLKEPAMFLVDQVPFLANLFKRRFRNAVT